MLTCTHRYMEQTYVHRQRAHQHSWTNPASHQISVVTQPLLCLHVQSNRQSVKQQLSDSISDTADEQIRVERHEMFHGELLAGLCSELLLSTLYVESLSLELLF